METEIPLDCNFPPPLLLQLHNENSLVQLALVSIAKKLEILKGISSIDHYNKLKQEGLIF